MYLNWILQKVLLVEYLKGWVQKGTKSYWIEKKKHVEPYIQFNP